MALGDYCTLSELKRELWPDDETPDGVNDVQLARIITQVSREIDAYTGTSFYDPGADETRYYTATCGEQVRIDPATTITSVATDDELNRSYSNVWVASTDYELWPYNNGGRGLPYAQINRSPLSSLAFPTFARGVKVVGRFCYNAAANPSTTLADIKQVALLKSVRMFKRMDAPLGSLSTGAAQILYQSGFGPDERSILDNYKVNYT